MDILVVITILFIVLFILTSKSEVKLTSCKQHKWVYMNEGTEIEYMQCSVCKRLPGVENGSVL